MAMDSYEEASANFEQAYGEDATYDRAIQIYGAYLNRGYGSRRNPLSGSCFCQELQKMQRIIVTVAEFYLFIWDDL